MKKSQQIVPNNSFTDFLLYTTPNGKVKIEIFLRDENIWLTQAKIAELFGVGIPAINKHLKNIFESGELQENSVISKMEITADDGKSYKTMFYNLDAILSVGYRVNSSRATQFRIWATDRLKEYIIKGFAMDDERLKNPNSIFGKDYFEEQLARIRDIRSSERRMYQKITDIYSQCSADYAPDNDITKQFFATVQNKLHFAMTGKTAAEIIYERADNSRTNMGLTVWKNSPKGSIRESDVVIAKNYLNKKELDLLNRIVTMYLDFAELQTERGIIMYMKDWVSKLDAFLKFNERQILGDAGKITHEVAEALALKEYKKYKIQQDKNYISDFDREVVKRIKKLENKSNAKKVACHSRLDPESIKKIMREEKEVKITKEIAEEIMADEVNFIEIARTNVFCHGCYHQKKEPIAMKIEEYILNDLGDIIMKGTCETCGGNCARYMECGENPKSQKIAKKYLKNAK